MFMYIFTWMYIKLLCIGNIYSPSILKYTYTYLYMKVVTTSVRCDAICRANQNEMKRKINARVMPSIDQQFMHINFKPWTQRKICKKRKIKNMKFLTLTHDNVYKYTFIFTYVALFFHQREIDYKNNRTITN